MLKRLVLIRSSLRNQLHQFFFLADFRSLQVGRIQVIAFQSLDGKQNHMMKPVSLSPVQKSSIIDVESSMSSSDNTMAVFGSSKGESMEQDTGDSDATARASKVCLNQHESWFLRISVVSVNAMVPFCRVLFPAAPTLTKYMMAWSAIIHSGPAK